MYLEIDEGFVTHRKTLRFCALMRDPNAFAYLMRLWSWACRSAPDGDLLGMESIDIEIAVQYREADGKCYEALVRAGFIDAGAGGQPERIHNWMERTGAAIQKMADEAARKKAWREAHGGAKCPGKDRCEACERLSVERPRTVRGQAPADPTDVQHRQDQSSPDKTRPVLDQGPPAGAPAIHLPPTPAPTSMHVLDVWCRTRFRILGGLELTARAGVSSEEVRNAVEFIAATDGASALVEPSMEDFWRSVKDGSHDAAEKAAKHNAFAFVCWFRLFPTDIERLSGVAPQIAAKGPGPPFGRMPSTATREAAARVLARHESLKP